jgi:hypothetical protein
MNGDTSTIRLARAGRNAYSGEISVGPRPSERENGFWDEPDMGRS